MRRDSNDLINLPQTSRTFLILAYAISTLAYNGRPIRWYVLIMERRALRQSENNKLSFASAFHLNMQNSVALPPFVTLIVGAFRAERCPY